MTGPIRRPAAPRGGFECHCRGVLHAARESNAHASCAQHARLQKTPRYPRRECTHALIVRFIDPWASPRLPVTVNTVPQPPLAASAGGPPSVPPSTGAPPSSGTRHAMLRHSGKAAGHSALVAQICRLPRIPHADWTWHVPPPPVQHTVPVVQSVELAQNQRAPARARCPRGARVVAARVARVRAAHLAGRAVRWCPAHQCAARWARRPRLARVGGSCCARAAHLTHVAVGAARARGRRLAGHQPTASWLARGPGGAVRVRRANLHGSGGAHARGARIGGCRSKSAGHRAARLRGGALAPRCAALARHPAAGTATCTAAAATAPAGAAARGARARHAAFCRAGVGGGPSAGRRNGHAEGHREQEMRIPHKFLPPRTRPRASAAPVECPQRRTIRQPVRGLSPAGFLLRRTPPG